MRLHHLEIQAFGPFAGTVAVDFDRLSEAGLFLLSGATGAGKTSVLDAVCFALYGDVPGDRSQAKRLRSDRADPATPPRVTLEATLSGRRFKIVRSPAWERAKKRGTGVTTEQARVALSERVGQDWQPLSSRLDETGDQISRLLGLDLAQFTQVALLPQGRFQAFLRAKSDERHRLLQQLFHTGRFEAVERWLRDRRLALGRESAVGHQRLADVVSRVSEAAGAPLPETLDVHDLAPAVDDDTLRPWVADALAMATDAGERAASTLEDAGRHEASARAALEAARADVARRERLVAARREHESLMARSADQAADVVRLDAARRAAVLMPWQLGAQTAEADAAAARADSDAALGRVAAALGEDVEVGALASLAEREVAAASAVEAMRPRVDRLREIRRAQQHHSERRARLAVDLDRIDQERAKRPARLEALRDELATARGEAADLDKLTAAAQDARTRLDAHEQAATLHPQLQDARELWLTAREETLRCKDQALAVQAARIEGMAAELAGALVVGACCPVCGSGEHPAKASAAPGAPDATAEKAARAAVDDAAAAEVAHDQQVRGLEQALAAAEAKAGEESPAALSARLADLQAGLGAAHRASARLPDLETRLASEERAAADLEARATELQGEDRRAADEHARLAEEADRLTIEVERVAGVAEPDLDALVDRHRRRAELCREATRWSEAAEAAARIHDVALRGLEEALLEARFTTVDDAQAACLDAAEIDRLEESVARHERRLAAVTEVLRQASSDEVDEHTPLPDVDLLAAEHATALRSLRAADATATRLTLQVTRLTGLLDTLDDALAAWAPVRRDHAVLTRLSAFVEGKSADNLLKMRLSAYVLAYRLSQVVAAANERLATMSDRRYSLEHTGQRGAGESRGGLSLLIRDDWSGERRDPVTLSGGETFVVSLALALGLADVISQEAGGAALDTLFVDEGFGSLDADTLDDVMDTLDSLRDGGRVVGVVSHVAEMRDRIPTQLRVVKHRQGSTLSLHR
ncbi:SMC family ATPase [Nocardioides sp. GXZ039]|uniref:SMC family ATPase n=1 Tax=Nocardioides sp. GXZ039 TaxID=3136018 RepID=UPI0030F3ED5B